MARKMHKYSVLMSVYKKDNPVFLRQSIESIINQTIKSDDIIIVLDGPITDELNSVLKEVRKENSSIRVVELKKNEGLGGALSAGLAKCKNDLVLRMDADDIAIPERAEIQLDYMNKHPEISVVGSDIYEFKNDIHESDIRIKKMPVDDEIKKYIKRRNPLNHMTVCFRKKQIEDVGGYMRLPLMEDYWLWARLFVNGGSINNIDKCLVYARIGNGFEKRRGNKSQLRSWRRIQKYMRKEKMIGFSRYTINNARMSALVFMPNFVRKRVYSIIRKR